MDRATGVEGGAKLRLVEAAEQLFAERGFDVVSVRDITKLAGANIASVNYHFGSRDGLVAAVMIRYMTPINEERLERLGVLERRWGAKPVPLEEVLDAFVRPVVSKIQMSDLSEQLFLKLVGRMFSMESADLPGVVVEQCRALATHFPRVLAKTLPGLSAEEVLWRMHFVVGAMYHAMSHSEILQSITQGASGNPTAKETLTRFLRFAAAGMREGTGEPTEALGKEEPQATFGF